jgi:hypothetical protein
MLILPRWSIAGCLSLLSSAAVVFVAVAGEPIAAPAAPANCSWLPLHWCVKAPYTCKPAPCPPAPCYDKCCGAYCAKPFPCLPSICQQWCPDNYCPKPPVCCFPGDPCPPCETKKHGKK